MKSRILVVVKFPQSCWPGVPYKAAGDNHSTLGIGAAKRFAQLRQATTQVEVAYFIHTCEVLTLYHAVFALRVLIPAYILLE
jgi:hypothetical protein